MKRLLLALALFALPLAGVLTLPLALSPALSAVATTKVTLNATTWTDLGVGPLLLTSSGNVVYAVADTTPALVAQGFPLQPNVNQVVNTASHVWAMATNTFTAYVFVSPIVGSGGGSGGSGAITAGTTATSGFIAGQLMISDGTKVQALTNGGAAQLGDPNIISLYMGGASSGAGPSPEIWFSNNATTYSGIGFHINGPYGNGISVGPSGYIGSNTADAWTGTIPDAAFSGMATGVAGFRNVKTPTSPESLRVYNTFTDTSNGEWGALDWQTTPNVLTIGTQQNGTGTARAVNISASGVSNVLNIGQFGLTVLGGGYYLVMGSGDQIQAPALVSNGVQPTITGAGGTCAAGTKVGGQTAGTVVLTGVCATTNTITWTGMAPFAQNGWACDAEDRTTRTALFVQSASTVSGFTFTTGAVSSVAGDVLQWKCIGY